MPQRATTDEVIVTLKAQVEPSRDKPTYKNECLTILFMFLTMY